MKGLSLQDIRQEIISLFDESTTELQNGSPEVALSILIEAQLLLCDAVQNEMNRIETTPPLVPLVEDSAAGARSMCSLSGISSEDLTPS